MSTIKNETWRLRGTDLEIACVLDTPAGSDRSPFDAAVYRAWVVGHEALTSAYGESPASAHEGAKERATGLPETAFDPRSLLTEIARIDRETVGLRALAAKTSLTEAAAAYAAACRGYAASEAEVKAACGRREDHEGLTASLDRNDAALVLMRDARFVLSLVAERVG